MREGWRRIHRAVLSIAVVAASAWASPVAAQQLRGSVRDSTSGVAIAGVVVTTFDASGRVLARTLANERGEFRIVAADAVRLQLLRIGFRPHELSLTSTSADTRLDVRMTALPTLLAAVHVEDQPLCPARGDRADALALWEQARAGLLATVVARTTNPAQVWSISYVRDVDPRDDQSILHQKTSRDSGVSARPFVPVATPSEFAKVGYLREVPAAHGTSREYDAPDPDVLLDKSFAGTHCFAIERDNRGHRGQIGLAFTPVPVRRDADTLVDVAGTVWIDSLSPALKEFEYRYTGLEPAASRAGAGGYQHFRAMPNGVVFIDGWHIRMPLLSQPSNTSPFVIRHRTANRGAFVSGVQVAGALVADAIWPDSSEWSAPLGALTGQVIAGDAPAPGVGVWLEDTDVSAITDSAGRFRFERVLPGPYVLRAADSTFASFGIAMSEETHITIPESPSARVIVQLRSEIATLSDICGRQLARNSGVLFVRVIAQDGRIVPKAHYQVRWQEGQHYQIGTAGDDGTFTVCGAPLGQPVLVEVGPTAESVSGKWITMRRSPRLTGAVITMLDTSSPELDY